MAAKKNSYLKNERLYADADETLDPIGTPDPKSVRGTFDLGGACQSHDVVIRHTFRN